MADQRDERPDETHPGEKGPPAWKERTGDREEPMPDEPPDSSSEVDQVMGLPPRTSPSDTDPGDEPDEPSGGAGPGSG